MTFRSGFVAVVGRPSVGKSTLLNAFLGQPLAPVSPRAQTTRRRLLGILHLPEAQVIFVDTPGLHTPRHKLGRHMNAEALEALRDADVVLALFDVSSSPSEEDGQAAEWIRSGRGDRPVVAALNKVDVVPEAGLQARISAYFAVFPDAEPIALSALRGDGRDLLLRRLVNLLPEGPAYFPETSITQTFERDLAADLIRAAALQLLRDEVPHSLAVRIEEFRERGESGAYIAATLLVERESHKGIVIGKNGSMLKELGTSARKAIESMSGRKVYLELRVKVLPGWRNDESALRRLGYDTGRDPP
ncbi:MAG: GTPase Era [Actinobacteria bacterium]|nr:GTPase Era [Actinomycetota bacterium]